MQSVGARLHDFIDDGAAVVAILRGEAVVLHLDFLQRLDRGLVIDIGGAPLALLWRRGERAVEANLGSGISLPVRDEIRSRRIRVVDPGSSGLGDAGGEEG